MSDGRRLPGGDAAVAFLHLAGDAASELFVDDAGRRWRLPRATVAAGPFAGARVCREVATERGLFHAAGTFFELPAENAGGFAKALELRHDQTVAVTFTLEADLCGDGRWTAVRDFVVPPGEAVRHTFPRAWSAYWVRLRANAACRATAQFTYR